MVMAQPRVVIDTNCLLQILGAKSRYHFLFESFLQFGYVLCISNEVLLEYEEILKIKASPLAADLFLRMIERSRNVIRKDPYFKWNIIAVDPDDNKFVDCAFACRANYIVTNDNHFQEVSNTPFPAIDVITLDDFVELIKQK